MQFDGPNNRKIEEQENVFLGSVNGGSTDYDYHYLRESNSVWRFASPNHMYGKAWWEPVDTSRYDEVKVEGKTLRQHVAELTKQDPPAKEQM